jgi:hypothetical protein
VVEETILLTIAIPLVAALAPLGGMLGLVAQLQASIVDDATQHREHGEPEEHHQGDPQHEGELSGIERDGATDPATGDRHAQDD